MPAPAVFLHHRRVLGAVDLCALLEFRDAHVAADALTDVLGPPFLDLFGKERIGDRRTRGADDVALAGFDDLP
jgi:hypothetical protein